MTEHDYTAKRLGSKVRGHKIVICPKCGKRGYEHKFTADRINRRSFTDIIHRESEIWEGTAWKSEESCYIRGGE